MADKDSTKSLREEIIQGVNLILLHNLVKPQNITNYINPEDIKEYRDWLEKEVDDSILSLLKERIRGTLLSDEEIEKHPYCTEETNDYWYAREIAQAQLDAVIKELE